MRDNFEPCLQVVLKHEGGYVDHPKDPGGATNLGITLKTLQAWRQGPVSKLNVRDLTVVEASRIYRAWYWQAVQGDVLPPGVDLMVFDLAVNSGPPRARRYLQLAVGVPDDGVIGPRTLDAIHKAKPGQVIEKIRRLRKTFFEQLPTFKTFGEGWMNRLRDVNAVALHMDAAANPEG